MNRLRVADVASRMKKAAAGWAKDAPAALRKRGFGAGLAYFAKARGAERDELAIHPALDYWLFLRDTHFAKPAPEEDWALQLGCFQGLPAVLAARLGSTLALDATMDPDGRFFLYGTPWYFEFEGAGRAPASLKVARGAVRLELAGGRKASVDLRKPAAGGPVKRLVEAAPGVVVDDLGWLQLHGVVMHGLERLDDAAKRSFAATLGVALSDMKERDPQLHAELASILRVVVPLKNPMNHGSVSSSYVNLRGLIALSPSDDPLLQAETFIHEFCHMKMNQLLVADPVLLPGQSGQVYYSPWRGDARRLRGLLLGAHAFLNVARYLGRSLQREEYEAERRLDVMSNVARRLFQVEFAMKALTEHGRFTPFGREFVLGMWREIGLVRHAMLWFPHALVDEQFLAAEAHRRQHALGETALHRTAELVDVPRERFAPAGKPLADAPPAPAAPEAPK